MSILVDRTGTVDVVGDLGLPYWATVRLHRRGRSRRATTAPPEDSPAVELSLLFYTAAIKAARFHQRVTAGLDQGGDTCLAIIREGASSWVPQILIIA